MAQIRKSKSDAEVLAPQAGAAAPVERQKSSTKKEDHPQGHRAASKGKPSKRHAQSDNDSALESLGKAVSAPVLGAADEDPDQPV